MNELLLVGNRVLIVDDEAQIGEVLSAYLERDGFEPVVRGSAGAAIQEIESNPPDAVLLDLTLPDGNGLDVLTRTRARNIPTIIVSARGDEIERVVGLEMGADDYITKPFSPREVVARVRAVLRRAQQTRSNAAVEVERIVVGELQIDETAHEVALAGQRVELTPSEYRILTVLARHPGQVFTRTQLFDALHDDGSIFERTLDRHINNLRHKIEPNRHEPTYVLTVYGVGYKMRKA